MAVWSTLLASLGAAGRSLLTSGADISDVLEQVSAGAGSATQAVLVSALVLGVAVAVVVGSKGLLPDPEDLGRDLRPKPPAGVPGAEKKEGALSRPSGDDRQ